MNDRRITHDGWPRWVSPLVALPPLFFAAGSLTADEGWLYTALVVVSVIPWLVEATDRRLPPSLFAALAVVPLAIVNLGGNALGFDLSGESHTQFTLMILVWLVGEAVTTATVTISATVTALVLAIIAGRSLVEPAFGHSWAFWVGGAGIALITGFMLRQQQATLSELRAAQEALAAEERRRERQRIAREVHDVVAHSLTATLMYLDAASRALDRDPGSARKALDDAKSLGRRSLNDIRRTVGLLRVEGDEPDTRALPDGSDVAGLLESYRAAGLDLEAAIDGDPQSLPPAAGLALYRVLQESLSNAAAHAAGSPVRARLRITARHVELEVTNGLTGREVRGSAGGGGNGLVGMEERVRLLGGSFHAGPRDGRWYVRARFPTQTDDATAGVRA